MLILNISMEQIKIAINTKNFSNGKIYIIRNIINDLIYIGSTCQLLSKRMSEHRRSINKKSCQKMKLYILMRELGTASFYIELLEEHACTNGEQLRKKEGMLIREHVPALNSRIEGRTNKEYINDNKDTLTAKAKEHYTLNADSINERRRQSREINADSINERRRQLHKINPYARKEQQKRYYEKNKDKLQEQNKIRSVLYHEQNKKAIYEQQKEYRQCKRDKINEYAKTYREANYESIKQKNNERYRINKEKRENSLITIHATN
jgi:hypothetical protein